MIGKARLRQGGILRNFREPSTALGSASTGSPTLHGFAVRS